MALTQVQTGMLQDQAVTTAKIADAGVTPSKMSQPLTSGTAQNTTSGTFVDFTSIPSWVKRITIEFNGLSTNSTGSTLVQIGTSSGVETTGYNSYGTLFTASLSSTAGFVIYNGNASFTTIGHMVLTNMGSNTWISSHQAMAGSGYFVMGGGSKTLSGVLDRLRITTTTGTDTFDAGSVNILYE